MHLFGACRQDALLGREELAIGDDTVIATRCIKDGYALLHKDSDFEPFVEHLGLRSVIRGLVRSSTASEERRALEQ